MKENKLIAEFMGYRECPMKLYRMDDKFQSVKIYSEYQDEDEYNTISAGARIIKFTPEQMEFHTSWDWLMPVIQKCLIGEAEQSEEISNLAIKNIYEGICNQDISLAYQSVVQFITNKNK